MAATRERSIAWFLRIESRARMTCCCRPITSSAGNSRSQAAAAFALCNGSATSLDGDVRNESIAFMDAAGARRGAELRVPLPSAILASVPGTRLQNLAELQFIAHNPARRKSVRQQI